eukprot:TRINITY_DN32190_c0_g1_i1.p3 TRINITY_DN32190_c0_g1~~TRINITY_DN32190_c0_g1_i1.p3  ORF type:complete len:107 (-),score=16.30 TRINITY_DN32190_c0_g1_i1:420-716(-)
MSPLVRMGPQLAFKVLKFIVLGTYALGLGFCVLGWLPVTASCVTVAGSYGVARAFLEFGGENYGDAGRIKPLKMYASKWHIMFHVAMCLGFCLARMVS